MHTLFDDIMLMFYKVDKVCNNKDKLFWMLWYFLWIEMTKITSLSLSKTKCILYYNYSASSLLSKHTFPGFDSYRALLRDRQCDVKSEQPH